MSPRPAFRYSLRSLLLLVAVAAIASLWYRDHLAFQRSPSKADGGGGYRINGDPQHLRTRVYRDHDHRLVAIVLLAFDELDVSAPRYQLAHGYDSRQGGWLKLDGAAIEPRATPRVFANDPHGRMVELNLSAAQAEDLASRRSAAELEWQYRRIVEPIFLKAEGRSDAKGRQGLWIFRLPGGELWKEVNYSEGLRHGEAISYYPGGTKKLQAHFRHGRPRGEWTIFDPAGKVLAIIDRGPSSKQPDGPASGRAARRWESQIDDQHGYRLFVDGAELKMPPSPPPP